MTNHLRFRAFEVEKVNRVSVSFVFIGSRFVKFFQSLFRLSDKWLKMKGG